MCIEVEGSSHVVGYVVAMVIQNLTFLTSFLFFFFAFCSISSEIQIRNEPHIYSDDGKPRDNTQHQSFG